MRKPIDSSETWKHCLDLVRVPLLLAPTDFLADIRQRLDEDGVLAAVRSYDTPTIFNWMISLIDRQGVSNRAAISFRHSHGGARWDDVNRAINRHSDCSKLRSFWHYSDCGFQKGRVACACSDLLPWCPVPTIPARKGTLGQAAISLGLFVRDVCVGDIVGWIDRRLSNADTGRDADRAAMMRASVLEPLINVAGSGRKVWSMILAELLLACDPDRERWVMTGSSFIAIDSLVHAHLHRTGILRSLQAEHAYGPACYLQNGCVGVIEQLAALIDAREFNPDFPTVFPRWIQFAFWWFCSEGGWAICNANTIDDRRCCDQRFCPSYRICDRVPVKHEASEA